MSSYILTDQKIPESKKNKEWHKAHIQSFVVFDSGSCARQTFQKGRLCPCHRDGAAFRFYDLDQSARHPAPVSIAWGIKTCM